MASLSVFTFDHEGHPIQFNTWLDDLQLYLLSDSRDSVSLFDHTSRVSLAPPATADSATRSQWLTHDAAARLAIRNHLPLAERAHFGQHKTAKVLYDAVVAHYSSPATAALGHLLLPHPFPKLSAFATVEDLVTHLCTSDARYHAALPAEFLDKNPPPMYITLYFIVTRLLDSLRAVRDHFLALDPTNHSVDLLEQHLIAAETSVVAIGAARGTPRTPFFEGGMPHSSKGKGGKSGGSGSTGGGGGGSGTGGGSGGGGSGGSGGGSGGFGGGGGGSGGRSDSSGSGGGRGGAVLRGGSGGGQRQQQHCWSETPSPQSRVAIFDLDYDAILAAMYDLSVSAEGDCYLCVPPDPGIEAAALGASDSSLPGTAPDEALHTFTLDSSASRCFFRNSTTLTPLPTPVPVRLVDPTWGPNLPRSCTVLPCLAVPSGSLPRLSCGTTALVTPPYHAFVTCTPASLFLVFPDLCLPSRPRLPRPAFLALRGARVTGQNHERYFLLVVDDYTLRLQLRQRFRQDLPVLRLHSDRGGEFSSDLLRDFCRGEGILQLFMLTASPQKNGIAERRIGLVMEVARNCMIHAAAPHFLWPFAVWYAAHQLNLWPRVSLPETLPTLRWTRKVGGASVFRVWGSRALVRDTSADKLSSCAIPFIFLGFPPDAPGWRFYHPNSRRVLPSQDVTFDDPPPIDPLPPQGPAPSGVSQVDPLPGTVPVEVTVDSGAVRGAASVGSASGGAASGGAESEGAESRGTEPEGVGPGGAESEGAESGGAEPWGTASSGGPAGPSPRLSPWQEPLSPQQLRDWFAQRTHLRSGAVGARDSAAGGTGAGGIGATRLGGARVTAGAGGTRGAVAAGPGGARTRGTGATGTGSVEGAGGAEGAGAGDPAEPGGAGAEGAGAGGTGAGGAGAGATRAVDAGAGGAGAGGAVLSLPSSTGLPPSLLSQPPCQSQPHLEPDSPLPAPSPYAERTTSFTEHREPESHPASPVRALRTGLRVPRPRPPPVPGTHAMALPPSSVLLRVPLPPPPESSLPAVLDPESDLARTASPIVSRLLATAVIDPSFESNTVSALVAELDDFATVCHLDYATALGTDILEDRQEDFDFLAATAPHLVAMLLAPEGDPDAPDIPTPRSYAEAITGTYVDAVLPSGANIVNGMWIFRVKWPQGSLPPFKARYVARGFRQPAPGDLATTPTWLHWVQWSLWRPVYGLRQAPHEWHNTMRTTLAALGFAPSTADPSLFLRTDTSLPPFYVLVYVDNLVFATTDTKALALVKSFSASASSTPRHSPLLYLPVTRSQLHLRTSPTSGMGLVLGGRGPVVLIGHADASWVDDLATQWSSQGYTFSLGSDSVSCRSTRSSSVLSSSCEAEIYAGAMAAQELRWLTYLLTDLGEQPRSPPVLYVDNKAMSALCQENRVEHRTKHITLRYFLARELQQRGELRLAYVSNRTNTTDIFTKALQSAVTTAVASLSFTLDSGVSRCFFRYHTTITPLSAPVPVALADPISGPTVACSSTTLPFPTVPSGFLTGLYIPSFSRNMGCLLLVCGTSVDKLSARAIPCVFLGFPVNSPDFSFYHPPLHHFLDSHDVWFDKSVSYYTRYPCRGLPVPPPPLFLAPSPTPASAPLVPPSPPGLAPSGVSHSTPLPSVARQVASPSPESSSQSPQHPSALPLQVTVDSGGVGARGTATRGTRSGDALLRGAGAGGAGPGGASLGGVGVGGDGTSGATSGGAGAGGIGTGGANSGGAGAPGAGAGGTGAMGARARGTGTGGASSEETGTGGTTTVPPHHNDTSLQVARRRERKEQERLEQERQELQQLDLQEQQYEWPSSAWSSFLSSCPLIVSYSPTFSPPDLALTDFSPPQSQSPPPILLHDWTTRSLPRARPSSLFDDLRTILFRSSPRRAPPVSVLRPPPASSLTVSSHPNTDYYRATRLVISHVLDSLVTDPRASPLSVSALTAAISTLLPPVALTSPRV
ncbi:unnamed protein product [Closterium sp. NIES-53]